MSFFNTIHKRKSAVKTAVVMALLLLSFFFVGMQYLEPPEEMGIEVNFGTSDTGSGDIQPLKPIKSEPLDIENPPEEVLSEVEPTKTSEDKGEEILTQDDTEALVIKKQKEAALKEKAIKEAEAKAEADRIAKEKRELDEKRKKLDALIGGVSKSEGNETGSEGDDKGSGDKGQIDGNPYANSYYGGGSGNGSGYGLKGRNKTTNQKFTQDCNEEGKVVVKIEVDRQGKVINAVPGVKGSTNTAACLLAPAKKTALSYRFNSDSKAPNRQIGFIVINFSLGQ